MNTQYQTDLLVIKRLTRNQQNFVAGWKNAGLNVIYCPDSLIQNGTVSPPVESSPTQFVALAEIPGSTADSTRLLETLETATCLLAAEPTAVAAVPMAASTQGPSLWSSVPLTVATLCVEPAWQFGLLIRRGAFEAAGGIRQVSHPVWDLLLRGMRRGWNALAMPMPNDVEAGQVAPLELPELSPRSLPHDRQWLREHLDDAVPRIAADMQGDSADSAALQAGIWQFHGELERSHRLSQAHEGEGRNQLPDYWHAIMHRREPDFGNAKYWFRRIGRQPVYGELHEWVNRWPGDGETAAVKRWHSVLTSQSAWDPLLFVDLCEAAATDCDLVRYARRIQWAEMVLLLKMTYQQTVGQ